MSAIPVGAIVVGVAELIKLGNAGLQIYFQMNQMANMTEAEIEAGFQKAKTEYFALPDPNSIPDPE